MVVSAGRASSPQHHGNAAFSNALPPLAPGVVPGGGLRRAVPAERWDAAALRVVEGEGTGSAGPGVARGYFLPNGRFPGAGAGKQKPL